MPLFRIYASATLNTLYFHKHLTFGGWKNCNTEFNTGWSQSI